MPETTHLTFERPSILSEPLEACDNEARGFTKVDLLLQHLNGKAAFRLEVCADLNSEEEAENNPTVDGETLHATEVAMAILRSILRGKSVLIKWGKKVSYRNLQRSADRSKERLTTCRNPVKRGRKEESWDQKNKRYRDEQNISSRTEKGRTSRNMSRRSTKAEIFHVYRLTLWVLAQKKRIELAET